MKTKDFFQKYKNWHTDNTNDSRGVLGRMDKGAMIHYSMFRDDVRSSIFSILVEYYHNEKPYFWGFPMEFPYTDETGPAPDGKPLIFKRSLDWYTVPEMAKTLKPQPLCFTILQNEFEITILVFEQKFSKYNKRGTKIIDLGRQYSKKEINSFLLNNR